METVNCVPLDVSGLNDTIALLQGYYSYLNEQAVRVQQIKGTTSQIQGPDGTLSSTSLNFVNMILFGSSTSKRS